MAYKLSLSIEGRWLRSLDLTSKKVNFVNDRLVKDFKQIQGVTNNKLKVIISQTFTAVQCTLRQALCRNRR